MTCSFSTPFNAQQRTPTEYHLCFLHSVSAVFFSPYSFQTWVSPCCPCSTDMNSPPFFSCHHFKIHSSHLFFCTSSTCHLPHVLCLTGSVIYGGFQLSTTLAFTYTNFVKTCLYSFHWSQVSRIP